MGQAASAFRAISRFNLLPNGRRRHPYALHSAAKRGDLEAIDFLIADGAKVDFCNEVGCSALHYAAREGHSEIVEALLAAGAALDPANVFGSTPLHWASDEGHAQIVERLCSGGAQPNSVTQVKNTPMHLAAKKGHTDVIEVLLRYSASFLLCNAESWIPLHLAARYGHVASIEVLLQVDSATVNLTDKNGRTALHMAAIGGHQDTLQLLLDMDADKNARDRSGCTPVDVGRTMGLSLFWPGGGSQTANRDTKASQPEDSGCLTGAAAELMGRLDPRLKHLVTPEALEQLNRADEQPGRHDLIDEDGEPLFATLSGVSLQFDWEEVRWERPIDHLLRQSLRGSVASSHLVAVVDRIRPPYASGDGGGNHNASTSGGGKSPRQGSTRKPPSYRLMHDRELQAATSDFAPGNILGEGGFGPVFKGRLEDGSDVAVKVLDSSGLQGEAQFICEVKILSRVRHPHLVKLVGSCPDRGALVYELLNAGSLEDRLASKGGGEPLPWQSRLCIAYEMACGLLYLHNCRPESVIHRDFKPANVLLDEYDTVKLGDVGLARLVPEVMESAARSHVQDSCPVGTFQYIDPEYMRTGQLSPRSDVFSLGITLLELLTGLQPNVVLEEVEDALQKGSLASILDRRAGEWPEDVAGMLARLGLAAAEMRRRKRPDLEVEILPVLRTLRNGILEEQLAFLLTKARALRDKLGGSPRPPVCFLCPISQDIMKDPVVASDGFAYDRQNLLRWLEESNVSPMTNLRLEDTSIMAPALILKQAIDEWSIITTR